MPVVAIVVGALVFGAGAWLWNRRAPAPSQRSGLTGTGRDELERKVASREGAGSPDRVTRASLETAGAVSVAAAAAAAAAFGAAAGPAGAIIGLGLGAFFGALIEGLNHEFYDRIVRDSIAEWNGDHGFPTSSAATDATLYRNALLGARHVYRGPGGAIAIEVLGSPRDTLDLSLFGGALQGPDKPFIPGHASTQCKQQMVGWSEGMLDGPSQRSRNAAWKRNARAGDLHVIQFVEPRSSWRTRGYVWFGQKWPLISFDKTRKTDRWEKVTPTADNIDALAAGFDLAAGVDWGQS